MKRIEDSPDLFGCGMGTLTTQEQKCDWCGVVYEEQDGPGGESVGFTNFGGKEICDCCFGKIENAVLVRMGDILPWYRKYMKTRYDDTVRRLRSIDKTELEETYEKAKDDAMNLLDATAQMVRNLVCILDERSPLPKDLTNDTLGRELNDFRGARRKAREAKE